MITMITSILIHRPIVSRSSLFFQLQIFFYHVWVTLIAREIQFSFYHKHFFLKNKTRSFIKRKNIQRRGKDRCFLTTIKLLFVCVYLCSVFCTIPHILIFKFLIKVPFSRINFFTQWNLWPFPQKWWGVGDVN